MEYDAFGNMTPTFYAADAGPADHADTPIPSPAHDPARLSSSGVGPPDDSDVRGGGTARRRRESAGDRATGDVTQVGARLETGAVAVTDLTYFGNGTLRWVTAPPNQSGQRYRLDYTYDST